MRYEGPILDNHLHLNRDDGDGLGAVETFVQAGGTHLLVVNQPSWSMGVEVDDPGDFDPVFQETIDLCTAAAAILPGRAWPVLGVHPALISRLTGERGFSIDEATSVMKGGIDRAASLVETGSALALKSGRPHYDVREAVWDASNHVLRHAIQQAATAECAIQLHTEATRSLPDVAKWAADAGLRSDRVVKHYADGPMGDVTSSVIARRDAIEEVVAADIPFLLETDYLDDPDRPGAVLGPKTVPRRTAWLVDTHGAEMAHRAHVETPATVYGIDTEGIGT